MYCSKPLAIIQGAKIEAYLEEVDSGKHAWKYPWDFQWIHKYLVSERERTAWLTEYNKECLHIYIYIHVCTECFRGL